MKEAVVVKAPRKDDETPLTVDVGQDEEDSDYEWVSEIVEDEIPSGFPDPEKKKWTDCWYYCGSRCLNHIPGLRGFLTSKAPEKVKVVPGGVDRVCCVLLVFQLIFAVFYVYFFRVGFTGCKQVRYLSLSKSPTCADVVKRMNDLYYIDDKGFWSTQYEWAFADSMVGADFVAFKTNYLDWQTGYAPQLWKTFDTWNTQWQNDPSAYNLMNLVVAERKVTGKSLMLAQTVGDPKALMNSHYKDVLAVNNLLKPNGAFALTYEDLGSSFFLGAPKSQWTAKLPKWKFATQTSADDELAADDEVDPYIGLGVNKYSLWVAAAVNMGILEIKDLTSLTETSFASAYAAVAGDAIETVEEDDGPATSLPAGTTCKLVDYYADGYCDSQNNVAACNWDGGDCCESTCGVGYLPTSECGGGGFDCKNPAAPDYGTSEVVTYDDDAIGATGDSGGSYYGYDYAGSYYGSYYGGSSCTPLTVHMYDSSCDGWEGNILRFDKDTELTLEEGCNGTATVCLKDGTYKPYACGGYYPSEVTWKVKMTEDDDAGGTFTYLEEGYASVKCDTTKATWELCGQVEIKLDNFRRRLAPQDEEEEVGGGVPTEEDEASAAAKRATDLDAEKRRRALYDRVGITDAPGPAGGGLRGRALPATMGKKGPTPTSDEEIVARRRELLQAAPTPVPIPPTPSPTVQSAYTLGLKEYVLYKYYEVMDPIECAYVNHSQYCWVTGSAGTKGTESEPLGAYLFPIIQHYDKDCYNCTKGKASKNKKSCNEVDLEYIMYFDPKLVFMPHFVHTFNATWREVRRPYNMDNAGLDGAIYMNFYGGVNFLNDLFYPLPNTHCVKPIGLAKGVKTKNAEACGTKYQQSLLHSKKKKIRKAAEKSYCQNPPLSPQELFYECWYGDQPCVSAGLAEAAAQTQIVATILGALVVLIGTMFMGLPKVKDKAPKGAPPVPEGPVNKIKAFLKAKALGCAKSCKTAVLGPPKPEPPPETKMVRRKKTFTTDDLHAEIKVLKNALKKSGMLETKPPSVHPKATAL